MQQYWNSAEAGVIIASMKSKYEERVEEWEPFFRARSALLKSGITKRKYQDVFCIPLFVALFFSLVSFSAYLIFLGYELYESTNFEINFLYNFTDLTHQPGAVWMAMTAVALGNIIMVAGFILLLCRYP